MKRSLGFALLLIVAPFVPAADKGKDDGPRIEKLNRPMEEIPKEWSAWGAAKKPVLKDYAGKVVLVHFWSVNDSSCNLNMKNYATWRKAYEDQGFAIIGMHVPPVEGNRNETDYKLLPESEKARLKEEVLLLDKAALERAKVLATEFPTVFCRDESYFHKVGGKVKSDADKTETTELGVPAFTLIDRKGNQRYFVEGILATRHADFSKKAEAKIEELLAEKKK